MPDGLTHPPDVIKLLADDLRWNLLQALTIGDHRVQELTALVSQPMNLVSYHLKKLRHAGIVGTRRSEADGRDIYYSLDLESLRSMYRAAGVALHPALGEILPVSPTISLPSSRVLFVCTHNSARSQIAEGLLRHLTGNQVEVFSAGSHPTRLHPDTIRTMDSLGIDIRDQHAKHLSEFEGQAFDYVITVCDQAREVCPSFPGCQMQIHWGFADPAAIGDAEERHRAFDRIARQLTSRIEFFLTTLSLHEG
jgi:protein-tyrosine-phosphatase